jgi:preprotein translocase subunit YajC
MVCVPAAAGRRFFRRLRPAPNGSQPEEVIVLGSLIAAASSSQGNPLSILPILILMVGVFYFLMIRPNQKRTQAQRSLLNSLEVGDEVVTTAGIFGAITAMDDEAVTLEVSPNVEIQFLRQAIMRKLVYDDDEYQDESQTEDEEAGDQQ